MDTQFTLAHYLRHMAVKAPFMGAAFLISITIALPYSILSAAGLGAIQGIFQKYIGMKTPYKFKSKISAIPFLILWAVMLVALYANNQYELLPLLKNNILIANLASVWAISSGIFALTGLLPQRN